MRWNKTSSNFVNSWQRNIPPENLKQTHVPPTQLNFICSYCTVPCKTYSNDFTAYHDTASNIRDTALPQTQNNPVTIKSGESYRSVSTARPYSTLLIWSTAWLLHGLDGLQYHVIDEATDQRRGGLCGMCENWTAGQHHTWNTCFDNMKLWSLLTITANVTWCYLM